MQTKAAKNKLLGAVVLIFALFGFFIFIYRLVVYNFEFDPQYSPVDYGKYNILSYFTVQSNFFCYVFLLFAALSVFGVKWAQKIGFSRFFQALVTTYVIVAGLTYTAGIPMGLTPPFKWDTAAHSFSSFIQVYYHMIIPPGMLLLWFFPFTDEKVGLKKARLAGIYPFVYSVFSVLRGNFGSMHYYPYPFYKTDFLWNIIGGGKPVNEPLAYLFMLALLLAGCSLFCGITALLLKITRKDKTV